MCLWDGNWWLACVLEVIQEDSLVKLTFLHPHGPNSSFKYLEIQDIRTVPLYIQEQELAVYTPCQRKKLLLPLKIVE